MSDQASAEDTARWQRRLASQANNQAWALAESTARTADEDEAMLHAAHAALHLWKTVGQAKQHAHAAQLLAHVYALLGLGRPAAHHLAQCQAYFAGDGVDDWERALAHAVAANVAAANHDADAQAAQHAQAVQAIAALPDPEDRRILQATLRVIPVPGAASPPSACA